MKAIETEYNGILFRSRLEARWAILFDALKKYEPFFYSGWELGSTEDGFDEDYVDELNKVKQYRFYK